MYFGVKPLPLHKTFISSWLNLNLLSRFKTYISSWLNLFFLTKFISIEITTLFLNKTFIFGKPTYPPIITPTYALVIVYFDWINYNIKCGYHNTLANSTLIILFYGFFKKFNNYYMIVWKVLETLTITCEKNWKP